MINYKSILKYYCDKEYRKCLLLLEEYLKNEDLNYDAHYLKAKCHINLREYDKAVLVLEFLINVHPEKDIILCGLGYIYFNRMEFEKAKQYYEDAVKINPFNIEAYFYQGRIYCDLKDYCTALDFYNRAELLNKNINNSGFNVNLYRAILFNEMKDYVKALNDIKKAEDNEPGNYFVYYIHGMINLHCDNFEIALENFKKAVKLNPEDYNSFYEIGTLYKRNDDIDSAIEYYNKALDIESGYPPLIFARAWCFFVKKEYDKSITDCIAYIKSSDKLPNSIVISLLAYNYFYSKDYSNASKYFDISLKLKPGDCEIIIYKGVSLIELGKYEEAMEVFNECLIIDTKYVKSYEYRGFCFLKLEQNDKAFEDFTQAIELGSRHPGVYHNRGLINLDRGNNIDAYLDLTKAKELGDERADSMIEKLCDILRHHI